MSIIFIDHQNRFCSLKSDFERQKKHKSSLLISVFINMNLFNNRAAALVGWKCKLQRQDKLFDHCHSLVIVKQTQISRRSVAPYLKNKRSLLWQILNGLLNGVRWDCSYIECQVIFYCHDKFDYLGKSVSIT